MSRFIITGSVRKNYGQDPYGGTEASFVSEYEDRVLVGVGFRVYNDDVTTMHLLYARLLHDGTIDQSDLLTIKRGTVPDHSLECWYQCGDPNEVIVGIGLRAYNDDMATMQVHTRKIDRNTGTLIDPYTIRTGIDPNHELEVDGAPEEDPEHMLLRGVGVRVRDDDVKTMELTFGTLSVTE